MLKKTKGKKTVNQEQQPIQNQSGLQDGFASYQQDDFATSRLVNEVLVYSIPEATAPVKMIIDRIDDGKILPMIKTEASVRYADLGFLNQLVSRRTDNVPADYVEESQGGGDVLDEDDVEVEIL